MAKARENQDHPFYQVLDLIGKVLEKSGPYLSSKDLTDFGIELSSMDIETGVIEDSGPQFCHLLPFDKFNKLFEERVSIDRWPEDKHGNDVFTAAYGIRLFLDECLGWGYDEDALAYESQYRARGRNGTPFDSVLGCAYRILDGEPEWQTSCIFEAHDESLPHRACLLYDGAVSDSRLRRSEVCCAAALMAARLRMVKIYHDPIVPVFVYSLSGHKARVIQAHYEHPKFIVRKTDHVLFEGESAHSLKLMLRWMINIPNIPQEYAKVSTAHTAP